MKLNVKYLFPQMPELVSRDGDSGYDIRAAIDNPVTIEPQSKADIPTGIAVEVEGTPTYSNRYSHELQIRPRSGQTRRGVIAQFGTIDASYRGEIWVTVYNINKEPVTIEPLERIAQIVICPIYKPEVAAVTNLTITERGTKGFGSTGRN